MKKMLATTKNILVWMIVAVLLLSLTACGAASKESSNAGAAADRYYSAENGLVAEKPSSSQAQLPENRKLIQRVRLQAETEDMDTLLEKVNTRIEELGGYVEGQQIHNGSAYSGSRYRNAELTIRIPAEKLGAFVSDVSAVSNIVSSNQTTEDVTLSYVATESRIKALETEQERLLELLAQAETMDDLLTIESRLTDVRSELEQVNSTLRLYDNQVDYSTVNLSVTEVREFTVVEEPETVWQRIGAGFMESLEDIGDGFVELFVFLVVNFPYLVIMGAILVVIILVIRTRIKKKKENTP